MSLYRNGVLETIARNAHWHHFREKNSIEISLPQSSSYTPTKDGTNICINPWAFNFDEDNIWAYAPSYGGDLAIRVECDIEYSGFDSSSTAGTFAMRWQGASYNRNNAAWEWTTSSPVATALNNQQSLTTLVNGNNGSFHYNNSYVIPISWLQTYSATRLGIRTDYSNGTGSIIVKNVKVYPDKYQNDNKVRFSNQKEVISNSFIEI